MLYFTVREYLRSKVSKIGKRKPKDLVRRVLHGYFGNFKVDATLA